MLRLYAPIVHEIFTLHTLLEHVVCNVWCEACEDVCEDKLQNEFKQIYHYVYKPGVSIKEEVERIYNICKFLSLEEKAIIKNAFIISNNIEELCNGALPIYLRQLPRVVAEDIKPFFKWCYEDLLNKSKVAGDKLKYYQLLIKQNNFKTCPCCGLIDFESFESKYREAYDHYLPKSKYPFATVNFQNLIPLCYKCNSDRKKVKDPIAGNRIVIYPFSKEEHSIEIKYRFSLTEDENLDVKLANLEVELIGNQSKLSTWDWLFDIKERYKEQVKGFAKSFLNEVKRWHKLLSKDNQLWSYKDTINVLIENYKHDYYDDKKFLKIAFLEALLEEESFIAATSHSK